MSPADTVLWITVNPKPRPPLLALGIDEKDFEKKRVGHIEGILYYVNENEGVTLEVYDGIVQVFLWAKQGRSTPPLQVSLFQTR